MIKNKKIKSLNYQPSIKCWILNNKYEIDNLGQVFWSKLYSKKDNNFPQYVLKIAEQLKDTFYYKFNNKGVN
jgi:hypothetical protein